MISIVNNRQRQLQQQQNQQPIIVRLQERPRITTTRKISIDDAPHFKSRLVKMGRLSSNHVMINRCRIVDGLHTLTRSKLLDDVALNHAIEMSKKQLIYPIEEEILTNTTKMMTLRNEKHSKEHIGQNVHRGYNIQYIQDLIEYSKDCVQSKRNMLSKDVEEFGMGTAIGDDGLLYMCQLYR